MSDATRRATGVGYEQVADDYLQKRELKRGAAGWVLLAGLGVAYVVSGDFAGWNFGLAEGGWGGLLIATLLMATMYTCMVFGLAEMASAIPVAGAGYGFARRALGPLGGFATGVAILIEYAIAPAAIAVFIGGHVEALGLFGLVSGWPIYLACYAIFIGFHLWGVGEALKVMFVITGVALLALVVFIVVMIPRFEVANLFDIAPTDALGASAFIPFGYAGVLSALVYGIWFFLAVEGVPLAAEEASDPRRDMPRGLITAPGLERPFRTPGGTVTTGVALALALMAVVATFFVDVAAAGWKALIFVAALAYFHFYSRHHLVASAPEEEFAAIQQAESELA